MTLRAIRSPLSALAFSTLLLLPFAARAQEVTVTSDTDVTASPDDEAVAAEPSVEWPLKRLYLRALCKAALGARHLRRRQVLVGPRPQPL